MFALAGYQLQVDHLFSQMNQDAGRNIADGQPSRQPDAWQLFTSFGTYTDVPKMKKNKCLNYKA
jgi:hypothetical protein